MYGYCLSRLSGWTGRSHALPRSAMVTVCLAPEKEVYIMKAVAVALGGAIGALMRYGCGSAIQALADQGFPYATLVVNLSGAFCIGFVSRLFETYLVSANIRALIVVGMIGSFTTFSTYVWESVELMNCKQYAPAVTNLAISVLLGLLMVVVGYAVAGTIGLSEKV